MNTLVVQLAVLRASQHGRLQKVAYVPANHLQKVAYGPANYWGDFKSWYGIGPESWRGRRPEGYATGKSVGPRGVRLAQPWQQTMGESTSQDVFKQPGPLAPGDPNWVNPALGSIDAMRHPIQRGRQGITRLTADAGRTFSQAAIKPLAPYLAKADAAFSSLGQMGRALPWALGGLGVYGAFSAYNQYQQSQAMQQMAKNRMNPFMAGYTDQAGPLSATRTVG